MSLRPAVSADAERIEAFLRRHAETSMFLRASLHRYGPEGGPESRAMKMWLAGNDDITGVIGHSPYGYVSVQMPEGIAPELRGLLAGRMVLGVTGLSAQVAALLPVLGVPDVPRAQPLYHLDLVAMVLPDGAGALRPVVEADADWLLLWRQTYVREVQGNDISEAVVRDWFESWLADDRLRVLEDAAGPLAITGFNAVLPDMVQVGAVFVPEQARGRGLARRAVALHLQEARAQGVQQAILFAASAAACKAYEAIGFQRIGDFALLELEKAQRISV